jgi:hypothetical protein
LLVFANTLAEAFGRSGGNFERCMTGDTMYDLFKGARDTAVSDLHSKQKRNARGDPNDRHQLTQRLDTQMTPIETKKRAKTDHRPISAVAGS